MPTLILLPGMACDAALWQHQQPALAAAAPGAVVVADVHGRAASLPAMAALLLAEQPGDLLLAGCSLGGMLAMELARQAPQRVQALALLGTTARPDTPELVHACAATPLPSSKPAAPSRCCAPTRCLPSTPATRRGWWTATSPCCCAPAPPAWCSRTGR